MKFREYVGEKKVKVRKEIVQTSIGATEADFLKKVARENPDGSKRNYNESLLGFGLNKKTLKRTFDYLKSWFIRYDISFTPVTPYLTVYVLNNLPTSSAKLINTIKKSKLGVVYNPKDTITIVSQDEKFPRKYNLEGIENEEHILLDYYPNKTYNRILEDIYEPMNIDVVFNHCYVKLFIVESGKINQRMYEDIIYSCPRLPKLKLGNVGLVRNN